jgi:DNA-binding CsgD family transcriptional regulator
VSAKHDFARDVEGARSGASHSHEEGASSDSISGLLGRAIEELAMTKPSASLDSECKQVLYEVDVDGCRYQIVRSAWPSSGAVNLSPRELEIARMVAKGYPSKTIAGVLEISAWTVSTHLRRIFAKLGVSSRAAMVACLLGAQPSRDAAHQHAGSPLTSHRGVIDIQAGPACSSKAPPQSKDSY